MDRRYNRFAEVSSTSKMLACSAPAVSAEFHCSGIPEIALSSICVVQAVSIIHRITNKDGEIPPSVSAEFPASTDRKIASHYDAPTDNARTYSGRTNQRRLGDPSRNYISVHSLGLRCCRNSFTPWRAFIVFYLLLRAKHIASRDQSSPRDCPDTECRSLCRFESTRRGNGPQRP